MVGGDAPPRDQPPPERPGRAARSPSVGRKNTKRGFASSTRSTSSGWAPSQARIDCIVARSGRDRAFVDQQPADAAVGMAVAGGEAEADRAPAGEAEPAASLHLEEEQVDLVPGPGDLEAAAGETALAADGVAVPGEARAGELEVGRRRIHRDRAARVGGHRPVDHRIEVGGDEDRVPRRARRARLRRRRSRGAPAPRAPRPRGRRRGRRGRGSGRGRGQRRSPPAVRRRTGRSGGWVCSHARLSPAAWRSVASDPLSSSDGPAAGGGAAVRHEPQRIAAAAAATARRDRARLTPATRGTRVRAARPR